MDVLRRAANRRPDGVALVGATARSPGDPQHWSYRRLDRWADRVAEWLADGGAGPGRLVATRLSPTPEAVVVFHAALRLGAVFLPLHPDWTDAESERALTATGTPALLVDDPAEVPEPETPHPEPESSKRSPDPEAAADPEQTAAMILTSGSTGAPRAVRLSHGNLEASAAAARRRLDLEPSDRWLASLALAHVGGLALVHRAAHVGCTLVTSKRFDAREVASRIDSGAASHLSLVPVMLARLIDQRGERPPPDSLKLVLIGGAATPPSLLERALAAGYPIALTYGLTEASSQVATAPPALVRAKPGTVGAPLPGVSVRIQEPDPEGRGEILVKGATVVTDPGGGPGEEAGPAHEPASVHVDAGGWLHTGDLGRLDGEGHLWVTGRRSDRIVTGGVTVEPAEVEAALLRHPAVAEVAVIGVPDPEWGERVVAVVVPTPNRPEPTLTDLVAFTRRRLGPAKRPRELRIAERLPRNANGKIDRRALRAD